MGSPSLSFKLEAIMRGVQPDPSCPGRNPVSFRKRHIIAVRVTNRDIRVKVFI